MILEYLEEKIFFIIASLIFTILLSIYLLLIGINYSIVILLAVLIILFISISLLISYFLVKKKYKKIINLVDSLEKVFSKKLNIEKGYYPYRSKW